MVSTIFLAGLIFAHQPDDDDAELRRTGNRSTMGCV
jgi:hypothetical protein